MSDKPGNLSSFDEFVVKTEERKRRAEKTIEAMKKKFDATLQKELELFNSLPIEKRARQFDAFEKTRAEKIAQFYNKIRSMYDQIFSTIADDLSERVNKLDQNLQNVDKDSIPNQEETKIESFVSEKNNNSTMANQYEQIRKKFQTLAGRINVQVEDIEERVRKNKQSLKRLDKKQTLKSKKIDLTTSNRKLH